MVPIFLAKYKEKVLHSGKYLNVIRESGIEIAYENPDHERVFVSGQRFSTEAGAGQDEDEEMKDAEAIDTSKMPVSKFDFYEPIEKAYEWSSQQLLQLIFDKCQLIKRLESIKHYFFIDKGDFFLHFVEGSEEILDTTTQNMSIEKLESYLEMAIRTSSANADPFKDDVSCTLNSYGLIEQLFAIRNIRGALGQNAFGLSTLANSA